MNPQTPNAPTPEGQDILNIGKEDASALLPLFKMRVSEIEDPALLVLYWSGFMAMVSGYCSANVGHGATQAIAKTIMDMAEKHARATTN